MCPDDGDAREYDACELLKTYDGPALRCLVDQGTADSFYEKKQLLPENLVEAAKAAGQTDVTVRLQAGYDHSYYFIASFVPDHVAFHAEKLKA